MKLRDIPRSVCVVATIYIFLFLLLQAYRAVNGYTEYDVLFKGATSVFFCILAYVCCSHSDHDAKYTRIFLVAFVFMCIADILMVYIPLTVPAMGCFAIGHILLIVAFMRYSGRSKMQFIVTAAFVVVAAIVFSLGAYYDIFDFGNMLLPACIYAVVISFMVGTAVSLLRFEKSWYTYCIAIGAILFFVSDFALMFDMFCTGVENAVQVNNVLYYSGQGILAVSFLGSFSKSTLQ